MNKDNTGFYVVIGIAIVGVAGYWAYNKYVKPKVEKITAAPKLFGIL
jgi:hypothetical protein